MRIDFQFYSPFIALCKCNDTFRTRTRLLRQGQETRESRTNGDQTTLAIIWSIDAAAAEGIETKSHEETTNDRRSSSPLKRQIKCVIQKLLRGTWNKRNVKLISIHRPPHPLLPSSRIRGEHQSRSDLKRRRQDKKKIREEKRKESVSKNKCASEYFSDLRKTFPLEEQIEDASENKCKQQRPVEHDEKENERRKLDGWETLHGCLEFKKGPNEAIREV